MFIQNHENQSLEIKFKITYDFHTTQLYGICIGFITSDN